MAQAIADVLVGAARVFLSFGPWAVVVLVVVVLWLAVARIVRTIETEARDRPWFWLAIWFWLRRRR
jgi:hypothetical protein